MVEQQSGLCPLTLLASAILVVGWIESANAIGQRDRHGPNDREPSSRRSLPLLELNTWSTKGPLVLDMPGRRREGPRKRFTKGHSAPGAVLIPSGPQMGLLQDPTLQARIGPGPFVGQIVPVAVALNAQRLAVFREMLGLGGNSFWDGVVEMWDRSTGEGSAVEISATELRLRRDSVPPAHFEAVPTL